MPRLTSREWSSARLIKVHFWTTGIGMAIYWIGLTWGGWFQGIQMNDPDVPFLDIVEYTVPFLFSRSVAAVLMTVGHIAFFVLLFRMLFAPGERREGPTLLGTPRKPREARV